MTNTITDELRYTVFNSGNPTQKFLYASPLSGAKLRKVGEKFSLYKTPNYKIFSRTIGDIILGFYKIEDTVPLLQQELGLDPKTAALLGAEVLEFLAPLSNPNWQPPVEVDDEEAEAGNVAIAQTEAPMSRIPVKAPAYYSDVAAAPIPSIASVEPMPTPTPNHVTPPPQPMYPPAAPSTPEPVYHSSQPAPTQPALSSIPSYTPTPTPTVPATPPPAPDRPRWSTDI